MKKIIDQIMKHVYVTSAVLAVILTLWCECWGRRSIQAVFQFIITSPFVFLFNILLVFAMLSIAVLFKRRIFYHTLISVLWIAIGLTNGIMLGFRNTPFTFVDIQLAKAGLGVMKSYMTSKQIGWIALIAVIIVIILIIIFIKAPRYEGKKRNLKECICLLLIFAAFLGSYKIGIETHQLAAKFRNLNLAYKAYGVPYCFGITLVDNGITRPFNYSKKTMASLEKKINAIPEEVPVKKPNIIFLQLESFFDVNHVKGSTYSENPLPNYDAYKKEFTSGFLSVPTYGAGTVNTEFEILTGMNKDFFGAGEYPYKSILQKVTCETMPNNLKSLGYQSHAIHNNTATFYDRNIIFSQMGFDTFTSSEYMYSEDKTPNGWLKDSMLTGEIIKALKSTEKQDFIYTISVQGHGEYPTADPETPPAITTNAFSDNKGRNNAFTYYVNEIHEMDTFLGELTDELNRLGEDTVLVIYGDHLPSLEITKYELDNKSIYETEYVIWNNMGLQKEDQNLQAYQLQAKVQKMLGMNEGIMTKYHQNFKSTKTYQKNMKLLQYDMLYGKGYIYNQVNPFQKSELQLGIDPIRIDAVSQEEEGVTVKGIHFTERSRIYINGKRKATEFISTEQINCPEGSLKAGDEVKVVQETKGRGQLSETNTYVVE